MIALQSPTDHEIAFEDSSVDEFIAESWDYPDSVEDGPTGDDWRLEEAVQNRWIDRNALCQELICMSVSSLSGYRELAELANHPRLRSFADVMVRQRTAQCEALWRMLSPDLDVDGNRPCPVLSAVRSQWRLAIWCFEQDRLAGFAECAERAESLLEEAILTVAHTMHDELRDQLLRSHAVMVCGARSRWEELADELVETRSLLFD